MNRTNVGNITTNAVQTMAVSGFTSAGYVQNKRRAKLADASSALNNLTEEEVEKVGQKRAEELREYIGETPETVDEAMEGESYSSLNSPQKKELELSTRRKLGWLSDYLKGLSNPNPVEEIIEEHKKRVRGEENADD